MPLIDVPPFEYGKLNPNSGNYPIDIVNITLDATTDRITVMFQVPKTGTLDRAEFLVGGGSSLGQLRCGWQDVSLTTGLPDGTFDEYADISGYSAGWQTIGGNYFGTGGASSGSRRSVTKGDLLAFVISPENAVTPNVQIACNDRATSSADSSSSWPRTYNNLTGSYAAITDQMFMALFYQGESEPTFLHSGFGYHALTTIQTVNASSAATRQVGIRFELPFPARITGCTVAGDLDASITWRLYDSDGLTDLVNGGSGLAWDPDIPAAITTHGHWNIVFPNTIELDANTTYRLVCENTSATANNFITFDVPSNAYLTTVAGGKEFYQTTATVAKASLSSLSDWTDDDNRRPMFGLILDQIDDGTGGGGGGEVYPDVGDVRSGEQYGPTGTDYTGTLTLPAVDDVRNGVDYGAGGTEFDGDLVLPSINDVQSGVGFGADGTEFTGVFVSPAQNDVQSGVTYGASAEFTGTFTAPGVGDVEAGVQYGGGGTEFTGTFAVPNVNDVRNGTDYGAGGVEFDGDLVLPAEADVELGVGYGADGTEFTGTLDPGGGGGGTFPLENDVRVGVIYGPNDTDFTGTIMLPDPTDVRDNLLYGAGEVEFEGTLFSPVESAVLAGYPYGAEDPPESSIYEFEGTLVVPATTDVRNGVIYGVGGTGSTGNVVLPAQADVEVGVQYGANGTQYTGTLDPGGGGSPTIYTGVSFPRVSREGTEETSV